MNILMNSDAARVMVEVASTEQPRYAADIARSLGIAASNCASYFQQLDLRGWLVDIAPGDDGQQSFTIVPAASRGRGKPPTLVTAGDRHWDAFTNAHVVAQSAMDTDQKQLFNAAKDDWLWSRVEAAPAIERQAATVGFLGGSALLNQQNRLFSAGGTVRKPNWFCNEAGWRTLIATAASSEARAESA